MAIGDSLKELQEFDFAAMDLNSMGMWPLLLRVIVLIILFIAVLVGGYMFLITDQLLEQEQLVAKEAELRSTFENKARNAANLEPLKRQQQEMEQRFEELLQQLPRETEVPELLDDITDTGLQNGLNFTAINLLQERTREYYIELPIAITVTGTYHDMGAFVSGVANLDRIVTLHDFSIVPLGRTGQLRMQIEARTYRYLETSGRRRRR